MCKFPQYSRQVYHSVKWRWVAAPEPQLSGLPCGERLEAQKPRNQMEISKEILWNIKRHPKKKEMHFWTRIPKPFYLKKTFNECHHDGGGAGLMIGPNRAKSDIQTHNFLNYRPKLKKLNTRPPRRTSATEWFNAKKTLCACSIKADLSSSGFEKKFISSSGFAITSLWKGLKLQLADAAFQKT